MTEMFVTPSQLALALQMQEEFNRIKVSNKFPNRPTDFHGVLGEIMFEQWLKDRGIEHKWEEFLTTNTKDPDFTFKNGSIGLDVKCTRFRKLYWQKVWWDYYVLIRPIEFQNNDVTKPTKVKIVGWMPKDELIQAQKEIDAGFKGRGGSEVQFNKKSYFMYPDKLRPMNELVEILKNL